VWCRSDFSISITSTTRPIAASAGRVRYAPAVAITRRTRAMAIPDRPTCITANGSVAGPLLVWKFTPRSPYAILNTYSSSRDTLMKHLTPINSKASRIQEHFEKRAVAVDDASLSADDDVVALQGGQGPHIPLGCSLVFDPGWEADSSGGTAGLCTPVERDLFDCHNGCYWPAQVPDQLNHAPDWTGKCEIG